MILTTAGRNLLAKALTGKMLSFTKAMCGNGRPGTKDPLTLTNLISPKRELPIQSMNTSSTGTAEVVVEMTNKNLTAGFFVYEYGLFARDPDTQNEILYSYTYTDNAGYLEGDNGVDLISYTLSLITVIDQAPNIQATITTANNYVTVSKLDSRIQDLFADSSAIKGFWTYAQNDTQRLRPVSLQSVRNSLIGTYDIDSLSAKLERLEDTVAQTLLELEVSNVYPGYSHFIIEDFKEINQLDMYECNVTSVVAGDDSIDCDPIDGMLPLSWYTLSDGINSELVQVESINLENGIQRVILTDTVKNTYNLENAKLCRTNVKFSDGDVVMNSDSRVQSWTPDLIWRGLSGNESRELKPELSVSDSDSVSLIGNAAVDSTLFITLKVI